MSVRSEQPGGADRARVRRRLWQLGGALALAAVVVVAIALASSGDDGSSKPKLRKGESFPGQIEAQARFAGIPQDGITLGDPKAPVTLVEFADLQCPYCRQYSIDVMPTLVADYVKTGKLKMVFRNLAFLGPDSVRAAQMVGAAGLQDKLWQYVDIFYNNQGEENSGYATDPFLRRIGRAVDGLDVTRAMSERDDDTVSKQLQEADAEAQASGITGTPSFLVGPTGGRLEPVEATAEEISGRIESALGKAS